MNKHTPGPWTAVKHSWSRTGIYSSGNVGIAALDISDEATEETQEVLESAMSANARLIAAAPELLSALKTFVEYGTDYTTAEYQAACAAVKKAEEA